MARSRTTPPPSTRTPAPRRPSTPRASRATRAAQVRVGEPAYAWAPVVSNRGFWEPVEVRAANPDGTFQVFAPATGQTSTVAATSLRPAPVDAFSRGALLLRFQKALDDFDRAASAIERTANARHPTLDTAWLVWFELRSRPQERDLLDKILTTPGAPLPTAADDRALATWADAQQAAMDRTLQTHRDFAAALDTEGEAAIPRYRQQIAAEKAAARVARAARTLPNPPRSPMARVRPGRFPRRVPPTHANPARTPSLVDRGHGIGRHSFNDYRVDRGSAPRNVREIIVSDVFGENTYRYNLDTLNIEPLRAQERRSAKPPWSWDQVREVVTRDLATIGRTFGEPYGTIERSTLYGLYHGKRPSWIPAEEWARKKGQRTLPNPPRDAPPGQRTITLANPSPMITEAEAHARMARLDQREAMLQRAASFGDPLRMVHSKADVDWQDDFSGNLLSGYGMQKNRERRQELLRRAENRIHHERFLARKALQQARQGSQYPAGMLLDWYVVAERGENMGFFTGPYATQDDANEAVYSTKRRAEETFGTRNVLGVAWGITGLPAGTPQKTWLPLHEPPPEPPKPRRASSKKTGASKPRRASSKKVVTLANPSSLMTQSDAETRLKNLPWREEMLRRASQGGPYSPVSMTREGPRGNHAKRRDLLRRAGVRMHHERVVAEEALRLAPAAAQYPADTLFDWYVVVDFGDRTEFVEGPYDTLDMASASVRHAAARAEHKFGAQRSQHGEWRVQLVPAGTLVKTWLSAPRPPKALSKRR